MKQPKLLSWLETCLNTGIGFVIAIAAQALIFPLFDFHPPLSTNVSIALIFTVISIVRGYLMRRLFEALHIRRTLSPFMQAVIAERYRQIEQEGWSHHHDDGHYTGELAMAGSFYARHAGMPAGEPPHGWPWSAHWWKPAGFRRDIVKACALIVAEGEKFDRQRRPRKFRKFIEIVLCFAVAAVVLCCLTLVVIVLAIFAAIESVVDRFKVRRVRR